jgi:Ca-activated chloride channel family protein
MGNHEGLEELMERAVRWRVLIEKPSVVRPASPGDRVEFHLVTEIVGEGSPVEQGRASMAVVLLLDASASMKGESLGQACRAAGLVAAMLRPEDRLAVVAFSDRATELVPLSPVTADTRRALRRRTEALEALGRTNIEAALLEGKKVLATGIPNEKRVAVLLSEGRPNCGVSDPRELEQLAAAYRPEVSLAALGFGPLHDASLLGGLALAGAGLYAFVPDAAEAMVDLSRAIGGQVDVVADDVQVTLVPGEGVEIVEVYDHKPRFTREGIVCDVPALREGQNQVIVAKLSVVVSGERGVQELAVVRVAHRPSGHGATVRAEARTSVIVAEREVVDSEARAFVELAAAQRLHRQASTAADHGNFEAAAAILSEAIARLTTVPGYRLMDGSTLSEAVERLVDERAACARRPSAEELDGDDKPLAILVQSKNGESNRVSLAGEECTVGRAPGNDLCLPGGNVSKRHARFFFREGQLFVTDLKSTNGTYLNRARINEPRPVKPGDRVYIGDYVIRFEEAPAPPAPRLGTVVPFPRR